MIDCTNRYMPVMCMEIGLMPTPLAQCIMCIRDGIAIAGAIYEGYNTYTIQTHIWIKEGFKPEKEWMVAIFDYPFNQLQVNKLIGQVSSKNEKACKLDEHFGFAVEAVVKDHSPDGDLLIYTMPRENCRILNSPKWAGILKVVGE